MMYMSPKTKKTTKKLRKVKKITKPKVEKPKIPPKEVEKYFEGIGRRKTAIARVRLLTLRSSREDEKIFLVNEKPIEKYFPTFELQEVCKAALERMQCLDKFRVSVIIRGGGLQGQAEAIRHGIARALVLFSPDFRKRLKKAGYLKRDPRMRERKKFGLKRARRAPQWQKR